MNHQYDQTINIIIFTPFIMFIKNVLLQDNLEDI